MINCVTTQICSTMYTNYCTHMLLNKPDLERDVKNREKYKVEKV